MEIPVVSKAHISVIFGLQENAKFIKKIYIARKGIRSMSPPSFNSMSLERDQIGCSLGTELGMW